MQRTVWTLAKTSVFTVIIPGTIAVYLPSTLQPGGLVFRPSDWSGVIALTMLAFGIGLYCVCAWNFAARGFGTPAPIDPPRKLVIAGPYQWTRNPMYVAVMSVLVGEALLARSSTLAVYALAVFVCFNVFVLAYEEPTLRRMFGRPYDEYCRRVPRWIGV